MYSKRSVELHSKWHEHNDNWTGIGWPFTDYITWLEDRCVHFEKCAGARYRVDQIGYTGDELIANLQAVVNQQAEQIAALERRLARAAIDEAGT